MEKLQGSSMMVVSPVSLPPSPSTSPSHDFSFTISLHNSSSYNTVPDNNNNNKSKTPPASSSSSIAIDLTPADDIFFHGHLLPLHLLSHLPVSPRSSINSLDSFTLPIKQLLEDNPISNPEKSSSESDNNIRTNNTTESTQGSSRQQKKSKSFSLFGFTRRQKGRVLEVEEKKHSKRKARFDMSHVLKRYVKMVRERPLLFFKGKREKLHNNNNNNIHRPQNYSFSGNLRNKKEEFMKGSYSSAPASMRTSPTNSGLLVATTPFHASTSDSTMEELQAAIQAAIAHCKDSIR